MRKAEYFNSPKKLSISSNISRLPSKLYLQERDWTCSIACMRSITSSIRYLGDEDNIVNKYAMKPGPFYSEQIKKLGVLSDYHVIYGCDFDSECYDIKKLYDLMSDGYYIMVESMIGFDHWLVLFDYITNNDEITEKQCLLLYDPYYDEIKKYNVDEFESVWLSGDYANNNIFKDFIAVK